MRPFLLGPALSRTTLPRSGGLSSGEGGMPLHDAVGVTCKMGASTENQGTGAW